MTSETAVTGAAALGPRFAAVVGAPDGWVAADDLFGTGFADAVGRYAVRCGAPHVAGALLFQQYAGLVVAPAVAALHEDGRRLPYDRAAIRVRLVDDAPVQVAFATPARAAGGTAEEHRLLAADLLRGHLGRTAEAVRRHCRTGARVLDGEIATAVATAFLHLSWRRTDRAALVAEARAVLVAAALDPLVAIETAEVDGRSWMFTGRRTCCLAFRAARNRGRGAFCATCPVRDAADVRRSYVDAVRSYQVRHAAG